MRGEHGGTDGDAKVNTEGHKGTGRGTRGSHHVAEVGAECPSGLVILHHAAVVEDLPAALTATGMHGVRDHQDWALCKVQPFPPWHTLLPTALAAPVTHTQPPALLAGALILQQGLGLLLADDGGLHLGGVHVHIQLPPHQEPHGGCKLGLCLQHLGRLLLDDEGAVGGRGMREAENDAGPTCPHTQLGPTCTW